MSFQAGEAKDLSEILDMANTVESIFAESYGKYSFEEIKFLHDN